MKRREFLVLTGGMIAWPFAVRAQDAGRIYRLGFLVPPSRETPAVVAFFDELRLSGFVEGQNLIVIPGGFGIRNDQIAEHAAALVKAAPDAIVCGSDPHTQALQRLTQSLPPPFSLWSLRRRRTLYQILRLLFPGEPPNLVCPQQGHYVKMQGVTFV